MTTVHHADTVRQAMSPALPQRARRRSIALALLTMIVCGYAALTIGAMVRQSTTFDEIVLIAGGARGFATGNFDLAPEHPPFTQYLYGLPVHLAGAELPEVELDFVRGGDMGTRYTYARLFFWASGNDPERLALLGRLPAVLCGVLTIVLVFAWTSGRAGAGAGLLAAGLVALVPDMLAHGGVAYNDIALAPAFFGALWAVDAALRRPTIPRAALAGCLAALALLVKFSAIALLPAAGLLLLLELGTRADRAVWLRRIAVATCALIVAFHVTLVIGYRGELTLEELRYGLGFTFMHVNEGHGAPAYLLGSTSATGWWYFYPVAFLLKTPAALHVLAAVAAGLTLKQAGDWKSVPRRLAASPLRMPMAGLIAFGAALLASSLNIGFRYALPMLPFLCVLVAIGLAGAWRNAARWQRGSLAGVLAWYAASVLWVYPNFLAYTSEYVADSGRGDGALLDSSLDWGQGLIQLRELMQRESIERVYLSYFGSALPGGYGIDYEPMPSFFAIPPVRAPGSAPAPAYLALSATNLHGIYLPGDPFAHFREIEPDFIVARSLFLYRLHD
jgi:4-amino-4-deoxy-L-arabinose transferase-like glycosyltransferase